MFIPVKGKNGQLALLNLDLIFAFVETSNGHKSIVALSSGGATFELPYSLEDMEKMLDDMEDSEDE